MAIRSSTCSLSVTEVSINDSDILRSRVGVGDFSFSGTSMVRSSIAVDKSSISGERTKKGSGKLTAFSSFFLGFRFDGAGGFSVEDNECYYVNIVFFTLKI